VFLESPLQPGAAGAKPAGQSGQFVAATGTAPTNRELVADESAATFGEDRRTVGQARPVLLAAAGGRPSEPAAVRHHVGPDRAAAGTGGVGMLVKFVSTSLFYTGLSRVKRRCCQSGSEQGAICVISVRIADR
jgi:hypothetical protein